jgi:hypothetical protein
MTGQERLEVDDGEGEPGEMEDLQDAISAISDLQSIVRYVQTESVGEIAACQLQGRINAPGT